MSLSLPFRWAAIAALAVGVSACGGGGDDGSVPPPACTPGSVTLTADANVVVGKAAGAAIAGCSVPVAQVQWTQTSGPAVTLLSDKTQAISFEPPLAGPYAFRVTYRDAGGLTQSQSVGVYASPAPGTSQVTVRADQAVRKGARVSLRAWTSLAAGDSVAPNGITWTQLEGPPVTLDLSDPLRPLFAAPEVATDTVLRFRATVKTAAGTTDSDEAMVLVENSAQAPANSTSYVFSDMHVSRVYPYRANGLFASVLVGCTYDAALRYTSATDNTLCPLGTLPFLHQTTNGALPTTAQIMDRVLVSHDWMGQVFEQFLNSSSASDDLKRLLNGVTAIVIGAQVRPSFYYSATGAIYLDADHFWLTPEQRDVISEVPDFRSDFDRDLQYSGVWRYAFNNQSIFLAFPPDQRIARALDYLINDVGWLLYHELSHASDFLPPDVRGTLNNALSPWDNIAPRYNAGQLPSDLLAAQYPLTSAEERALAQVKFLTGPQPGASVNGIPYSTLTGYTPQQVGGFFSADRATDEYGYATIREDIAMTSEEFLMQRNHGIRRDVAITDKITSTTTSQTLIVRWGQRGRIGDAAVKPRAQYVVGRLEPWVLQADPNAVNNLPAPLAMRAGDSWAGNLVLPAPPPPGGQVGAFARQTPVLSAAEDRRLLARALSGSHGGRTVFGAVGDVRAGHWTPNDRWLERRRAQ